MRWFVGILALSLLFIGCGEKATEDTKEVANKAIDSVGEASKNTKEETQKVVDNIVENTKKTTEEVTQKTEQFVEKVVEDTKKISSEAKENTQGVVDQIIDKTKKASDEVVKSATAVKEDLKQKVHTATTPKPDGKKLYAGCAACHGPKGNAKALNASAVINGWSEEKIYNSLIGYKEGTYGGTMKSVMSGQVKYLSDEQLKALSHYIASL